jgi:glyoxylase-like metal-dependent hydrolase (beta-lactamase superfamily II)
MVFVGDIVFSNVHSYMNDGYSERWVKVLTELRTYLKSHTTLFTGHGNPDSADKLINKQIDYIEKYRETIFSFRSDNQTLSDKQKDELYNIISEAFPQYKLTAFIKAGADAVAKECFG